MFDSLKMKLEGKKTYITAIIGLLVGAVAVLFGPVDLGPVHVPAMDANSFFKILWETLLFVFLRKGVSNAQ